MCLRAVMSQYAKFRGKERKAYYLETGDEDYGDENHVYPDIDL